MAIFGKLSARKRLILLLALVAIPAISFAQIENTNSGRGEIQTIKKIIGEKTPEFLAKPVVAAVQAIEKFRKDMAVKTEGEVYHFVFDNAYVFYVIFTVIVLMLLRTIWRIIF